MAKDKIIDATENNYLSFQERLKTYTESISNGHYYDIPENKKDFLDRDFRFGNKMKPTDFKRFLDKDYVEEYEDFSEYMGIPHVSLFSLKIYQLTRLSSAKEVSLHTGLSKSLIATHVQRCKYHLRGGYNYKIINNKKRDLNIGRILVKTVSLSTTTGETVNESISPIEESF